MRHGELRRVRLRSVTLKCRAVFALFAAAAIAVGTGGPALATGDLSAAQWDMRQIGAPAAWARTMGAGVKVGIVDTGADPNHEDLGGKVVAFANCVGGCKDAGAFDDNGHGTHVSGISAAANNGIGINGVAPAAQLVVAKVLDSSGSGSVDDVNAGIHWVVDHGAQVVNLSLGSETSLLSLFGDSSLSDGVEYAWTHGSVAVLAAGNTNFFGLGSSNYGSAHAIVVGSTGPDGEVASYSSPLGNAMWGIVAPGGDDTDQADCSDTGQQQSRCVLSTWPGNRYAWDQGTSMATPHVTGTVALLRSEGLSAAQAVQRVLDTAAKVPCGQGCQGRLDTAAAVGLAATPPPASQKGTGSPLPSGSTTNVPRKTSPSTSRASSPATSGAPSASSSSSTTAAPPAIEPPLGDNPVVAAGAPKSTPGHKSDDSSRAGQVALAVGLVGAAGLGAGLIGRRLKGAAAR